MTETEVSSPQGTNFSSSLQKLTPIRGRKPYYPAVIRADAHFVYKSLPLYGDGNSCTLETNSSVDTVSKSNTR